jgi:hypothetical protein
VKVHPVHRLCESAMDRLAYLAIRTIRFNFDWMSGWSFGIPTENKALVRFIFLESIAGVPGSIAAILRHLASLRRLKRDNGWVSCTQKHTEPDCPPALL